MNGMRFKRDGYNHEFIMAHIEDEKGNLVVRDSVSMTELEKALKKQGKAEAFDDYCDFEKMLRLQLRKKLLDLAAADSYQDDANEPGEHKRDYAKFLLVSDLNRTLFDHRERLMVSATC